MRKLCFRKAKLYHLWGSGACKVEVRILSYGSGKEERLCYTLIPCRDPGSTIFTPVDNQKVLMRPVMTREEAMDLIGQMREISPLWIQNERKREEEYREAVRTCDGKTVRIIKTIYLRRRKMKRGKRLQRQTAATLNWQRIICTESWPSRWIWSVTR